MNEAQKARDAVSFDEGSRTVGGRRLVFSPYPDQSSYVSCGGGACAVFGECRCLTRAVRSLCTNGSRKDRLYGYWKEMPQ